MFSAVPMTGADGVAVMLAALGAVLFGLATVRQHGAVQDTMPSDRRGLSATLKSFWNLIREPAWLIGRVQAIVAGGLHILALALAPITLVQPIGVLAVPVTVATTALKRRRRLSGAQITGSVPERWRGRRTDGASAGAQQQRLGAAELGVADRHGGHSDGRRDRRDRSRQEAPYARAVCHVGSGSRHILRIEPHTHPGHRSHPGDPDFHRPPRSPGHRSGIVSALTAVAGVVFLSTDYPLKSRTRRRSNAFWSGFLDDHGHARPT